MQTGGAEANEVSWMGSAYQEDMQGIQVGNCKKGVKGKELCSDKLGGDSLQGSKSPIKLLYLLFRFYHMNMSPYHTI